MLALANLTTRAAEPAPPPWQITHVGRPPAPSWTEVDRALRRLARDQRAHDAEEARWLVAGRASGVHLHLGMATYLEYLERVLGYPPRLAAERLRVAESLAHLPALAAALAAGTLSWSALRELTRVALPASEAAWLAAATGRTVRDVEALVAGKRPGDLPDDPVEPARVRRVLRLELSAATYALFRQASRQVIEDSGGPLSDDEVVAALCRAVLGGPAEPGRASHQIAVSVCPRCQQAEVAGGGASLPIDGARLAQAGCDAQEIGDSGAAQPARASQSVPPAVRRLVVRRDGGRCRVPGCRNARFLEVHHIVTRADGGSHEPTNLILMCDGHHRATHVGRLRIEGTAPAALRFLHADGRPYGSEPGAEAPTGEPARPAPAPEAVVAMVHGALRGLQLRPAELRAAMQAVRTHVGVKVTAEELLRVALKAVPSPALGR